MYTSLDRIDLAIPAEDTGRTEYVLTDHRNAAEVESEPEISVLFALTRVLAAKSMAARERGGDVTYACLGGAPPASLQEAVTTAGGRFTVNLEPASFPPSARSVNDLADAAFRALAERVRLRMDGTLGEALLQRLETETLQTPPDKEEEEGAYWTRVHELAALCGEVLRSKLGGQWAQAEDLGGLLPFAFKTPNATFYVADKAQSFVDHGESQRVSKLLRAADELRQPAEGPLMVSLKAGDFPREKVVYRELLERASPSVGPLPIVAVGRDRPNTFAYLPAGTNDAEAAFAEALANLARLELAAEEHEVAGIKVLVISGHFYASEKILDRAFMQSLHHRLGVKLLAAAIPVKGELLVTGDAMPPGVETFAAMAKMRFRGANARVPLSPAVLLVTDGDVVGHVEVGAEA
jgi:hypothetical protein